MTKQTDADEAISRLVDGDTADGVVSCVVCAHHQQPISIKVSDAVASAHQVHAVGSVADTPTTGPSGRYVNFTLAIGTTGSKTGELWLPASVPYHRAARPLPNTQLTATRAGLRYLNSQLTLACDLHELRRDSATAHKPSSPSTHS